MAAAFSTSVPAIEKEVAALIQDNQIQVGALLGPGCGPAPRAAARPLRTRGPR
jgi:hypothetical protein